MEKKYKKILFDMAESISLNENSATQYLIENGVDVNSYLSLGLREIRKKQFLLKAEENLRKHQYLLEKAINKIKNALPETIVNIENIIKEKHPLFQYRNLQQLSDNQLVEMLEDYDLINIIEEIEDK